MSNSSDGRGRGPRYVPPRQSEPDTRAERAYPIEAWPPQEELAGWDARGAEAAWYQEQLRADQEANGEPRTFEFHPTPLQARVSRQIPTVAPSAPAVPPPPPAARPMSPPDRAPRAELPQPSLGTAEREPQRGVIAAPARRRRSKGETAPIVPAGSVTGRSLTMVVAIMCFLACLTTGAVYMMHQSADAWLHDLASEVTVQVEAGETVDTDKVVGDVTAFLRRENGVSGARALSVDTSTTLLEPWLGNAELLANLPIPRLIAVEIDRSNPPDLPDLGRRLSATFAGTVLDDHTRWRRRIRTVTRSFSLGGLAILLLVGAATTAVIISATRSALASNREIVEVLHFVGATDKFIASQFQRHFLWLGVRAGIFGAMLAGFGFLAVPVAMHFLGGSSTSVAELQQLVGTGELDVTGYLWLGVVVLVVATLCSITSRIGVYRILNSQH